MSCGSDKKVKLWNPVTGLLLKTYGGHAHEVTDAAGSCDSCYIVSASLDKSIIYWDVSTGQPVRRLRSHAGGVSCVGFNEDSSVAVSGSKDNTVMCWDIRTRSLDPIQVLKGARDCITSLIITDHEIITSSLDGSIRHYDLRVGQLTTDDIGIPITHISQTRDGQCILAACQDETLRLIDSDSGQMLQEYKGHRTEDFQIECGILSNDSQIISGSTDGCAVIWDLLEGTEVKRLKIGFDVIHSLANHPTGTDIVFAQKREIQVWGEPIFEIVEL